jgi:hypothetical protein
MPVKDLCALASVKHRKNRGRYRRNHLATMFFLTMTASVRVSASDIPPRQVLNPYTELGLSSIWLNKSLGLPDWRVIVPIVIVPHWVIPAVSRKLMIRWTLQREDERRKRLRERLSRKYPPWDGDVSRWIYEEEPTPPSDVSNAFFGDYADIAPPFQDTCSDALLEDPIYGESPYLWDTKGELICMQLKIGPQAEKARFDTDLGT